MHRVVSTVLSLILTTQNGLRGLESLAERAGRLGSRGVQGSVRRAFAPWTWIYRTPATGGGGQ